MRKSGLSHGRGLRPSGFTMIELLVATGVFLLLCFAVYRTTWQYFRAYMKTDDKLENLTEAWQVLRLIKEDLAYADFPAGDRSKWRDLIQLDTNALSFLRRYDDKLVSVTYSVDLAAGNLSRATTGTRENLVLRKRLKNLTVETVTRPDATTLAAVAVPQAVSFKIRLVLAKIQTDQNKATPLVLETMVVPMFANARLQGRFCQEELPSALSRQP